MGFLGRCCGFAICVATAALSYGQAFQFFATTGDGSVLYFASGVRARGAAGSLDSKIWRWDAAGGFRVAAESDRGALDGCTYSNFYRLTAPSVSADGSVLAFTGQRDGASARVCAPVETSQGVIGFRSGELRIPGLTAISGNGRYAVSAPADAVGSRYHFVTDLTTNSTTAVAGAFAGAWDTITDEGAVLSAERMALVLSDRNGLTRLFPTRYAVDLALVDRSGRTAVYVTRLSPSGPGRITSLDLSNGRETELATGFNIQSPSIAGNGTVFFVEAGQVYMTSGTAARQLTKETDGIVSALVSGDGRVVFAWTGGARLIRVDVFTGEVTELAAATPFVSGAYRLFLPATDFAPGNVVELAGSGLRGLTSVSLCDRDVPATDSGSARIRFQVPLDLPSGQCTLIVRGPVFEHGIPVQVREYDPRFGPLLIHEDFRSFVSSASPARRGEAIVAYMDGLGPVDGTGRIRRPGFLCRMDGLDAPVLFAALTAEYPGTYQVNLVVPNVQSAQPTLVCGWDVDSQASTNLYVDR